MKEIKNPDLAALLAAAAAPEPDPDERGLESVLVAYRAAPYTRPEHAPSTDRPPRRAVPGGMFLKFAAAVVVLAGGGVAAASVGALPDSIQRIAHDYLGGVGVPAPPRGSASPNANASASPGHGRNSPSASLSAAPDASGTATASLSPSSSVSPNVSASPSPATSAGSNDLVTLCRIVVQTGKNWHSKVDQAQRTTLVNAAGSVPNVLPYCTNLINGSPSNGTNSTPATPSTTPSATASSKHGGGDDGLPSGSGNGQD